MRRAAAPAASRPPVPDPRSCDAPLQRCNEVIMRRGRRIAQGLLLTAEPPPAEPLERRRRRAGGWEHPPQEVSRCPNPLPAGSLDDQLTARLLHQRIIVLGQEVDDPIANRLCAELLLLSAEDPHARHQPLHQLARRLGLGGAGHLRHDAADPQRRQHAGDGTGGQHGPVPALGRYAGQALRAAALPGADAPGLGRHRRHGRRHRDPGREPRAHQERDDAPDRRAHRPARREGRARRRCATAGSPPRRRASTASSTRSSATSPP